MHSLDVMFSRFILCLLEYGIWTKVSSSTIQTLKVITIQDLAIWLDFVAKKVSWLYASYQNELENMHTIDSFWNICEASKTDFVLNTYSVQLVA